MINFKKLWKENKGFILFIALMSVFRSSFADWYHVPTGSMEPNIQVGDRILVQKAAYRIDIPFTDIGIQHDTPARGDVVVFNSEAANNRLVKRVIGVPGDTVSLINNRLTVNNESAQYRLETSQTTEVIGEMQRLVKTSGAIHPNKSFSTVRVPEGHLLVLGDNRDNSADSRVYGFVPISEIAGKASNILYSLDSDAYYLPRTTRFFKKI